MNTTSGVTKLVDRRLRPSSRIFRRIGLRAGTFVFARADGTDIDLYVVHKDGTGLQRLTNTPDRLELQPSFSPDGTKVVFPCLPPSGWPEPALRQLRAKRRRQRRDRGHNRSRLLPTPDMFTGDRVNPFWGAGTTGTGPTGGAGERAAQSHPAGRHILGPGGYAERVCLHDLPPARRLRHAGQLSAAFRPTAGRCGCRTLDASRVHTATRYSGQRGMFIHNPGLGPQGISTHFPDPGVFKPPYNDFVPDTSLSGSIRLVRTTAGGGGRP